MSDQDDHDCLLRYRLSVYSFDLGGPDETGPWIQVTRTDVPTATAEFVASEDQEWCKWADVQAEVTRRTQENEQLRFQRAKRNEEVVSLAQENARLSDDRRAVLDSCQRHEDSIARLESFGRELHQENARLKAQVLAIAGEVNGYHNGGATISAEETLRGVADALGDPFAATSA